MTSTHHTLDAHQPLPALRSAMITGQADKWFFLGGDNAATGERALRAESCLLQPELGDTVLVCSGVVVGVTTVSYVLAVLSRTDPQQGALMLPGGATLTADNGSLSIAARQIDLAGQQALKLQAPQLAITAVQASMTFNSLNTIAQTITTTVGRLLQRATDSFRWTQNLDESRAGRMRLQVSERLHIKAKHASMIAEGQVKIDGEKIDLG
jgi:hypothetical protein